MGKGYEGEAANKYAVAEKSTVAAADPIKTAGAAAPGGGSGGGAAGSTGTTDKKKKKGKKGKDEKPPFELVEDYDGIESEANICDPHRSSRILPGLVGDDDDEVDGLGKPAYAPLELEAVKPPKLGAFNSVDPDKAKAYEKYCIAVGKHELTHGKWQPAIEIANKGLDICPESKKLDKIMVEGYLSWGNIALSRKNWGDASH